MSAEKDWDPEEYCWARHDPKFKHQTEGAAICAKVGTAVTNVNRRDRKTTHSGMVIAHWQCQYCNCWHLGRKHKE